jgi:CheY-like chemotaxis protein/anti-sigma regulatory factor (Ser/Thr protein kinase)
LSTLIDEVATTIKPMVEKNANTLHMERSDELGWMRADQVKVRQALFNLLSNAAKFTHEGTVTLDAARKRMDGSDWIVFRITDTGIGLSDEKVLRLFQDFSQADASTTRKFGGTGLGLALTRRFCQMMGGDVTVSSIEGEGSTFTIKLPADVGELKAEVSELAPETREYRSPGNRSTDPLTEPSTCVLVIDDDPVQRELMERFLTKEGFSVRVAGSGEEGLRFARQIMPIAITLDVMMPDMDGWSVLETLKADPLLHDIPVIMLTMVDDAQRGFALGAADYVTKPVNRRRLSRILKRYSCANPPCPILIVDDDPVTRRLMRNMLEKAGCQVNEAENGEAALKLMETVRPSLVFLDLLMPVMDGFEFADRMRRHAEWRSIPIVVVTAHDLTGAERRRLNGYVETIIQKIGFSQDELLSQVRDALNTCAVPAVSAPPA